MTLTSIHYARLIMWLAYDKHRTILNKTQLQKILFVCYGLYIAQKNTSAGNIEHRLFNDEKPKAWPFGPVFPRTYKSFYKFPYTLLDSEKAEFLKDKPTLIQIYNIVNSMYGMSARDLTRWSHQEGSPWSKALFAEKGKLKWNAEISDKSIYEYFNGSEWQIGLTA